MIWAVLAVAASLSQRAVRASWLMTATQAILTSLVFVLAFSYGEGGMNEQQVRAAVQPPSHVSAGTSRNGQHRFDGG